MEKTINRINLQHLYKALQSLGYCPTKTADRTSEWRRSQHHLYTHPFGKKGIKLSLHKDQWKQPPPTFTHKATSQGKDIERELQRIQQKYSETAQAG
jgi:hypothetical protein